MKGDPNLAFRTAAMLHRCMIAVPLSKRGAVTIPPGFRRRLGLDKMSNPMFIVEERDGGLFLQPAAAVPSRDLPTEKIPTKAPKDQASPRRRKAAFEGKAS